jgi:dipeptidyl aminopeptidase/acylaminoacyl peptidase
VVSSNAALPSPRVLYYLQRLQCRSEYQVYSTAMKPGAKSLIHFAVLLCVSLQLPLRTMAQNQRPAPSRATAVLDSMPHAKKIDQAVVSPDGTQVAYIVDGQLMVAPVSGGAARAISLKDKVQAREVTWSADSKQLAVVADLPGDIPVAQIWTAAINDTGGAPAKRAELKGYVETPRFSRDGGTLAVLFIEGLPRAAGPLQPMIPLAGVIDEKIYEQRLTTINLKTNKLTQVTPADVYVYEYDWTPDGTAWVATAAPGSGDANWWVARLYRVNSATGEMREIYAPKWQMEDPHVSPDGANVAIIEGLMSDESITGGDVVVVSMKDGRTRNVTPNIKASPSAIAWASADRILFAADVDGNSGFGSASVGAGGGEPQILWTGEELTGGWLPGGSFSGDGTVAAAVRQSASAPPEVWAGPVGKWKQITHVNDGIRPAWGAMHNVHWQNGDAWVQGWLMLPKDHAPGKTYPLVVSVHGGPSAACTSHWDEGLAGAASAMGYFVLCPNPRGSYGQGEAFTQGNIKDFGDGDYKDIMAGIDAISREYPIDSKRIGIRGHSYGGYMTMWAESQTQRFAAAVAGAGLSDWLSYYGLNDIDEWMIPFFGASVYDDPAVYEKSDPMHFVKAVKTPTLIMVGDRDGEVPTEQSVEWWHALKNLNVPTKLVIYPNEGHLFVKPADARDYNLRTLEWFDEWFTKAAR